MAWYSIELDTDRDYSFEISVNAGGTEVELTMRLAYNSEGYFWSMDITREDSGEMLISAMPLLTGGENARDILGQFQHFGLEHMEIVRVTEAAATDSPDITGFVSDFMLIRGSDD